MKINILEKQVDINIGFDEPIRFLLAQIPNSLERNESYFKLNDVKKKTRLLNSIFNLIALRTENVHLANFIIFPEASMPESYFVTLSKNIKKYLIPGSVVFAGFEHITLKDYAAYLERFKEDNEEAFEEVKSDLETQDPSKPVNWCVMIVKERNGSIHHYFQAKTHPFMREEALGRNKDLYHGKHFYLFRVKDKSFNFLNMICFDYLHRTIRYSNIGEIIKKSNQLYFEQRQHLDLLIITECNPKPEHLSFWETVSGFYGEYLEFTPGVRNTATIFCNTSSETSFEGVVEPNFYGYSSMVLSKKHKMLPVRFNEFCIDNFRGAPVGRLRFERGTRLYFVDLFLYHEPDPRSERIPVKVNAIFKKGSKGGWARIPNLELLDEGSLKGQPHTF